MCNLPLPENIVTFPERFARSSKGISASGLLLFGHDNWSIIQSNDSAICRDAFFAGKAC